MNTNRHYQGAHADRSEYGVNRNGDANNQHGDLDEGDSKSSRWAGFGSQKKSDAEKRVDELRDQVKQLKEQLQNQDENYAQKLKEMQTSFNSLQLQQTQIGDKLGKFESRGVELKKQQEDYNRNANETFEKVRREIIADQESRAQATREMKSRLDQLDVDKALIMERLKHLREDLNRAMERSGRGGVGGAVEHVRETESTVQRMEVDLKRLQAESGQQGKLLIGTACGAVVIVAYLFAAKA